MSLNGRPPRRLGAVNQRREIPPGVPSGLVFDLPTRSESGCNGDPRRKLTA